jgi:hypothetical protein
MITQIMHLRLFGTVKMPDGDILHRLAIELPCFGSIVRYATAMGAPNKIQLFISPRVRISAVGTNTYFRLFWIVVTPKTHIPATYRAITMGHSLGHFYFDFHVSTMAAQLHDLLSNDAKFQGQFT